MADTPEPETPQELHLTAWHVFANEIIKHFANPRRLEIREFDKLGTLPLEADAMLIRKKDLEAAGAADEALMTGPLAFLGPRLGELTALEYKGPGDVLGWEDVDKARVYALLGKRKYKLLRDAQVRVVMMYSYASKGLFEALAADGLPFEQEEEGIRCHRGSLRMYAVDLVALGKQKPDSPMNLVSARHRHYIREAHLDPHTMALVQRIEYLIKQGTVRGMRFSELKGSEEVERDVDEFQRQYLESIEPEKRLRGLGVEERLRGLGAEERLRGLGAEERLRGLGTEDLFKGLKAEAKAKLLALLLAERDK